MKLCVECKLIEVINKDYCDIRCMNIAMSRRHSDKQKAKFEQNCMRECSGCKKLFKLKYEKKNIKTCSVGCHKKTKSEGAKARMAKGNPMKNPETAAKTSKTRKEKFAADPSWRENVSRILREQWANGVYDGVPVGKCKWYPHTKPDGSVVKLQGTWEVAFARWMDTNRIDYKAHRGRIPFIGSDGTEHSYYPDFYIPQSRMYVDVKGAFWDSEQAEKIDLIRKSNPKLNLFIANKEIFKEFRINYSTVQDELL